MNTQKNKKHRSRVASILSIILVGCIALTTALFSDRVATFISIIANYPSIDVTYDANGGYFDTVDNDLNIVTYEDGSVIKGEYKEPDHSSYYMRFDGWYTDQECTEGNEFDPDRDTLLRKENITVYAKWKDVRVNVIYDANGGHFENSSTNALEYVEGTHTDGTYEEPEHDTNYLAFAGWYTDKACSKGNEFDPATFNYAELTADKTVYAKWKKVPGLYQTGSEYTVLLKDWDTLIAEGLVEVTDGTLSKADRSMAGDLLVAETVTGAAKNLLYRNDALTGITLPVNFKDLGMGAFNLAPALTHVRVDEDNTNFCSVDDNLYSEDKTVFYCYPIGKTATSFTVPDGVVAVEYAAFAHCPYLEKVTLPEGLEYIGYYSFASCEALEKVNIPDEVYYIDTEAFWGCISLENVTFPDGLLYIDYAAFSRCKSFTEITLPASLEYLGNSAFEYCSSLEKVTFEDGIKITALRDYTFRACTSLKEITVPEGVTSIGYKTFAECTSLEKITLPDTVNTIGQYAFPTPSDPPIAGTNGYWFSVSKWGAFTADEIPAKVAETYIAVNPANKVTYNPNGGIFTKGPRKEAGLYVPDTDKLVKTWDELVSGGIVKAEGTTITDTNLTLEGDLVIPEGITTIGMDAFENETKLIGVFMPESLTNIYSEGFDSCTNLKEVVLSNTITAIQSYAFKGCNELESIYIPESVTAINYNAFEGCTALADVYYSGTQTKWNSISVGANNESLTNADVTYDFDFNKINEVGYYKGTVTAGTYIEPTKKAHKFLGWYTDAECTDGKEFDPETDVAELDEDITVYAKWEQVYPVLQAWTSSSTSDFHNSAYKSKITTAEIVDYMETPESPAAGPWDVSEAKNGSVMAWLTTEDGGTTYHLTISGNGYGKVFANTDSSYAFYYFKELKTLEGTNILELGGLVGAGNENNIDTWKVKPVTTVQSMFYQCNKLTNINVSNWNTSHIKIMDAMFNACLVLSELDIATKEVTSTDGTKYIAWDVSSVKDMSSMFGSCYKINNLDVSNWNTSSAQEMENMFYNCYVLTNLGENNVSKWDTSSVTNMYNMFAGCAALPMLDIETKEITLADGTEYIAWNVSSVKNMQSMFADCKKLASLGENNVKNWNTGSVINMSYMFRNCKALTKLDVSDWNTVSVQNMKYMFDNCIILKDLGINNVSKWNTVAVTDMSYMFNNCISLTDLNVGEKDVTLEDGTTYTAWNVSSVKDMKFMFAGCGQIEELNVADWNTQSLTNINALFMNCKSLFNLGENNISNWKLTNISSSGSQNVFLGCSSLESLTIPDSLKYLGSQFAALCPKLTNITFNHAEDDTIVFPTPGNYGAFYVGSPYDSTNLLMTNLTTENDTVKEYLWNTDNRGFPVNVIYNANGGKIGEADSNTVKYNPQTKAVMNGTYSEPVQARKEFVGWFTDEDCTAGNEFDVTTYEFDLSKSGQEINVYAKWENVPFTVTYNANGGNFGSDVTTNAVEYKGTDVINGEYKEPTRKAHEFLGWYTDAECKDGNEFNLTADLEDITVYAKWNPIYPILKTPLSSAEYKTKITSAEIVDYMEVPESPAVGPWDASEKQNGSVMAWLTTEDGGSTYHLTISGNGYGKVFAAENFTGKFNSYSKLTTFEGLEILELGGLKNIDGSWEVKPTTTVSTLFSDCSSLESIDVSNWDLSYVTDTSGMFYDCSMLTELDLSKWDTSSVINMTKMFYKCNKLIELGDINTHITENGEGETYIAWDTGSVCDLSNMFYYCKSLKEIDISNWDTSSVLNGESGAYNYNGVLAMFKECSSLITVGDLSTKEVTLSDGTKYTAWDVTKFNTSTQMFYNCSSLLNLNLNNWNVSNFDKTTEMFYNCKNLKTLKTNGWELETCVDASKMFMGCSSLVAVEGIETWNMQKVNNMLSMFRSCSSLTTLPIGNWNVNTVMQMGHMFNDCSSLTTLPVDNWDVSRVRTMGNMFGNCSSLTKLNVSKWDTSRLQTADSMFLGCKKLTDLGEGNVATKEVTLSNGTKYIAWDTSNVTSMSVMFYGCSSLEDLDVSKWNTSSVTNMGSMFTNCSALKEIDVSKWSTSKVTALGYMFGGCSSLKTVPIDNWDTSSVTSISDMFAGCFALENINISKWNLAKVNNQSSASNVFSGCSSLKELTIPSSLSYIGGKFAADCLSLKDITFLHDKDAALTFPAAGISTGAFYTGSSLATNLNTVNDLVLGYAWSTDRRSVTSTGISAVTITYDANGGSFISDSSTNTVKYKLSSDMIMAGEYIEPTYEYAAKTFAGWFTDAESTTPFDVTAATTDTTVYAKWNDIQFTVTYNANNGVFGTEATNPVSYLIGTGTVTKISKTDNVSDDGSTYGSGYAANLETVDILSIPGAESLEVSAKYQTHSISYDWLAIYDGSVTPTSSNYSSSIAGKRLGGTTKTTATYTVPGDTVQFYFKSNNSSNKYYGYYATVTGVGRIANQTTDNYAIPTRDGYEFAGWYTDAACTDGNEFDVNGSLSDVTVYAKWVEPSATTLDLLPRDEMDNMAYWQSVVNQMMDGTTEITLDSAITEMPMDVIDAVSYMDAPVTFIWNEHTFVIGLETINDFEYVSGHLVSIADLATNYAAIEETVEDEVVATESEESDVIDETIEDTEEDVIDETQPDTETEGEDVITEENGEEPVDPESSQPAEDTNPENSESEEDNTENNNLSDSNGNGVEDGAPEEGTPSPEPRTGDNSRTSDIEGNPENTETEQPAVSPDENQDAGTEGEDTNVTEPEETEPATETDGNSQSVEEPTVNNENSSDASEEGALAEDSNFSEDDRVDLSLEEPDTDENRDYWQSIVNQIMAGTTEIILDNTVNEMPLEVIDALNQLETSVKFTWNDQVFVLNQETINDFADFTNENVLISDLATKYVFVEEGAEIEETEIPSKQDNVETTENTESKESTVSPDESQDEGSEGEVINETEPVETELAPEIVEDTETVNEAA